MNRIIKKGAIPEEVVSDCARHRSLQAYFLRYRFCVMVMQYGIAIRNVCVRTEPTMEPLRKYEGDVWDRRQESRLTIGESVQLKRIENGWLYVISDSTEGYAAEEGIFICTRRRYEEYRERLDREYQVVLKAGRDKDGRYFRVGTVLPLFEGDGTGFGCLKDRTGRRSGSRRTMRYKEHNDETPIFLKGYLPFTERQIRLQMERMLGIPYSWGDERADGMDCSSTVRGFYACFGYALPRNSSEQRCSGEILAGMNQAIYKNLEGLPSEKKKEVIAGLGTGAVLHMPGHVMLYAGEKNGVPLIFHNCDVYTADGVEHVVRKCIISEFLPKGGGTYLDYLTAAWIPCGKEIKKCLRP